MKTLRFVVLLGLAVVLMAGCSALPAVFPESESTPVFAITAAVVTSAVVQEPATVAAPTVSEPATAAPAPSEPAVVAPGNATAAPAPAEGAVEPAATPSADQVMGANPLVGTVWEWAAMLKTKAAAQSVVPDPASYTLVFGEDGNLLVKADCNNARATYTLDNDILAIQLGTVTNATCPPGSLAGDFLTGLSKVGSYMIDAGDLILRVADTGDSMLYRSGGPSAQPAAGPTEAVAGAPAAATVAATAAATAVVATPTATQVIATRAETPAAAPAETTAPTLVGPVWQWEKFVDTAAARNNFDVKTPANYTVTFQADGTASMKADCNQAAGTYKVDGANLTVEVGPVTLAACAADSLTSDFLINLTSGGTYAFGDGKLIVDLVADAGRMVFGIAR